MLNLRMRWMIATTNDNPRHIIESRWWQSKFVNRKLENIALNREKSLDIFTDDNDEDEKEKTKEIIILIFPDGREDEE